MSLKTQNVEFLCPSVANLDIFRPPVPKGYEIMMNLWTVCRSEGSSKYVAASVVSFIVKLARRASQFEEMPMLLSRVSALFLKRIQLIFVLSSRCR